MAQHDYVIANQSGSAFRADLNNALAASVSTNSGSSAPSTTYAYMLWADTTNNVIKLRNSANNAWITLFTTAGGLDVDAASNFNEDVTFTGASYNLVWDKSDNALEFADNAKAKFGDSADLQLYHDSTNSYLMNNTGTLRIRGNDIRLQDINGENYIKNTQNGAVELYYDNSRKLRTLSNGVELDDNLYLLDSKEIRLGSGEDFRFYHDGSDSYIDEAGSGDLKIRSTSGIQLQNGSENYLACHPDGAVKLYHDNSQKVVTTSSGCTVYGTVNETSDIALKKDITPLSNSLAKVKQLNGYSYKFKDTDIASIGFTAQDVEKVYPDLVEGEEGEKGLNYSGLIAPLVEAIKELNTKIETLETKVAALEAK